MRKTDDILQVANVKLGEVLLWLKRNDSSPLLPETHLKILRSIVREQTPLSTFAKEYNVTSVRILQIYYSALRKVCAIIKSEKVHLMNSDSGKGFELNYDVRDVMINADEKNIKSATEALHRSAYSIVWSDKIITALKKNDINFIGEIVLSYRKLHYTPKLGSQSKLMIEKELQVLGLKFIDKDISPRKKVIEQPEIK